MSPEDRLSFYIDALIEGRRPPSCEGDEEWELLLETVRRVRRLAPPATPERDFPQRLAAALSHQLGGRRAGARWGLRRMTVFLGTAAAVLVLCFASYGYGRWSVEGRWPWWPSPPAETARERSAVEPGAPEQPSLAPVAGAGEQERAAVRQEASQLASPSGPAAGTGGRERAIKGGPEVPAAGDRVRAAPAATGPVGPVMKPPPGPGGQAAPVGLTTEQVPAAGFAGEPSPPAGGVFCAAGAPTDRGGAGTAEGGMPPVTPAGAAPEKTQEYSVAGRAGEEEGRRPTVCLDAGGVPARTPAALVQGTPAADPGITLIFGQREYRAVEVVRAGALAAPLLELIGEGRARSLPDGERVPVYRRPDSVPTEVYTPLGEFWVRWAPAEPPGRGSPIPGPR